MKLANYFQADQLIQDGDFTCLGYADSPKPGTLAFCDSIFYLKKANANPHLTGIITSPELAGEVARNRGIVAAANPRRAFYQLHNVLIENALPQVLADYGQGSNCNIHPTAVVSPRTKIGDHVTIAENAVVKAETEIGDHTFIDANAVIGSDGLLYFEEDGRTRFIRHAGGVKVGRRVTILSSAVIVKSVHDSLLTEVGDRSIIGVGTNVGHEAQVGKDCAISSHCVIARRARVSDGVRMGPGAIIREHVRIGPGAHVRMGSAVIEDVVARQSVSGSFAVDHKISLKAYHRKKNNL